MALPPLFIVVLLFVFFCGISIGVRRLVLRRCGEDSREELVEQAKNLLTGVSATFAFFVGFAISISWGAVTAGQNAVEEQSAAIQQMAWELRSIPDKDASTELMDKLKAYTVAAANADDAFLARGETSALPSTAALNDFGQALDRYVNRPGSAAGASSGLLRGASSLASSAAAVAAVANRALPGPLAALLFTVAMLVTVVMGMTTVTGGRPTMIFVYVWCLIPALSLTVVLALAFPFALRSGMTLAPLRALATSFGT